MPSRSARSAILVVLFRTGLFWTALCCSSMAFADVSLKEIVQNIRDYEALYDSIDVRLKEVYSRTDQDFRVQASDTLVVEETLATWYVSQDGLFRLERDGEATLHGGDRHSRDRTRLFDGQTTKVFSQGAVGHLVKGRSDDSYFVRPHMLLLRYNFLMVPLSVYLEGHEAMAAHPNGHWNNGYVLRNSYEGECEYQGLKCHRVRITTFLSPDSDRPHDAWELWLAEERNLIPVRRLAFTFRYSETIPVGEAFVDKWEELQSGVWFPMHATIVSYNKPLLKREGRQEAQWRKEFTVDSVSLAPDYDLAFFEDLEFPQGTAVYEVEDGEIVRSRRVGAPGPITQEETRRTWFYWMWSLALPLVLVAVLAARKYRADRRS